MAMKAVILTVLEMKDSLTGAGGRIFIGVISTIWPIRDGRPPNDFLAGVVATGDAGGAGSGESGANLTRFLTDADRLRSTDVDLAGDLGAVGLDKFCMQ